MQVGFKMNVYCVFVVCLNGFYFVLFNINVYLVYRNRFSISK